MSCVLRFWMGKTRLLVSGQSTVLGREGKVSAPRSGGLATRLGAESKEIRCRPLESVVKRLRVDVSTLRRGSLSLTLITVKISHHLHQLSLDNSSSKQNLPHEQLYES